MERSGPSGDDGVGRGAEVASWASTVAASRDDSVAKLPRSSGVGSSGRGSGGAVVFHHGGGGAVVR